MTLQSFFIILMDNHQLILFLPEARNLTELCLLSSESPKLRERAHMSFHRSLSLHTYSNLSLIISISLICSFSPFPQP